MALPAVPDLRDYLRIETTVEDALLDRLLAQSVAAVEAYIRQPITARAVTLPVTAQRVATPSGACAVRLAFPHAPIGATVAVADADGTTVDPSTYVVNAATGSLRPSPTATTAPFTDGAVYTVTATAGLDLRADYTVAIEPTLSAAIIDWAADLYQRRNPAASYESGGGGVAVNYNETASKTMPSRIRVTLDPWRRMLV